MNNPENQDIIGICRIPLNGLLINNMIKCDFDFPVTNVKGQNIGTLVESILMNEISNLVSVKTKASQDQLLKKLAEELYLKKGYNNIDNAFNYFDIDQKQEISKENFKDVFLYFLKFTTSPQEVNQLIGIIFKGGKTSINKVDFYNIFSGF